MTAEHGRGIPRFQSWALDRTGFAIEDRLEGAGELPARQGDVGLTVQARRLAAVPF